jgi:hypothetical protein
LLRPYAASVTVPPGGILRALLDEVIRDLYHFVTIGQAGGKSGGMLTEELMAA